MRLEPFHNHEVPKVIQELFENDDFTNGLQQFMPETLYRYILKIKDNIQTVNDFQSMVMHPFLKNLVNTTMTSLTYSGIENLNSNERYLFISNHRDIVLDTAFKNMLLFENDITTSQMAIGDNLIIHRITEILFRLNKSFIVKRTGTPRELYQHSVKLSKYMYETVMTQQDSVWVAQRGGRAKDGNDKTQVAVLKMLSISSGKGDLKTHFQHLNIVPVSISYEFDPTDQLKVKEYLHKLAYPNHQKTFQEDVQSMFSGIRGFKGKVHFHYSKPLKEELNVLDDCKNNKEKLERLAQIIDHSILTNYQLHPINYVALDVLNASMEHQNYYSAADKTSFEQKLNTIKTAEGKRYLLNMYANPLKNALSLQNDNIQLVK